MSGRTGDVAGAAPSPSAAAAGDAAPVGVPRAAGLPLDAGATVSPWRLVPLLLLVASAGYVCRTAVTVAGPGIMADFRLTQAELGTVFSAFLAGYTLCQVPSGWLADRVNPRTLFLVMLVAWTALTAGTALVHPAGAALLGGLPLLLAVRALFGVSAAPTYPASARTIGVNLPAHMQGSANGAVLASIGIGSALTPLAVGAAVRAWGWRPALLLSAALAGIALIAWWAAAPRNLRVEPPAKAVDSGIPRSGVAQDAGTPRSGVAQDFGIPRSGVAQDFGIPRSGVGRDGGTPRSGVAQDAGMPGRPERTASLASSRSFWCLVGSYTLQGYLGYIFVFWFYLYLVQVRHFEVMRAAAITALPWICTLLAIPLGGALSDAAVRRFGATLGRRLLPLPALVLAGGLLVVGARAEAAWLAVACLTLCTVLVIGTEGPFWATLNQVARRHGGTGGGIMNFGSNLGGMISPVVTPWLAARIGWAPALSATAVLALVAGGLWLGVEVGETE